MKKDSLAFLLVTEKHIFCNIQLFAQNTNFLNSPEDFSICQRTSDLQIPTEKFNLISISNRKIFHRISPSHHKWRLI